jgi:hypothetical protein
VAGRRCVRDGGEDGVEAADRVYWRELRAASGPKLTAKFGWIDWAYVGIDLQAHMSCARSVQNRYFSLIGNKCR